MKELDSVILIENYNNISKGTKGVIVLMYPSEECEVEYFDSEGITIDVLTTPLRYLEKL